MTEAGSSETAESLRLRLTDTEFVFYGWEASLILLISMCAIYKMYGAMSLILVSVVFTAYMWIFLLVRLDQLACALGKNPNSWVYSSLLIPFIGNFISFYFIRQLARQKLQELQSIPT